MMNEKEITELAAYVGVKAAMDWVEQKRELEKNERYDSRLHNTKLLLRNFRSFKAHAENAVYKAELATYEDEREDTPLEILEDFMEGRNDKLTVESIRRSATRTAIIVQHIQTMMRLYRAYCEISGTDEDLRRWRVVNAFYIEEPKQSISKIAASEGVVERTVYKDIDAAVEKISALMFGIDGLQSGRK